MKEVSKSEVVAINAKVAALAVAGKLLEKCGVAAAYIRETFKPTDAAWSESVALAYGAIAYMAEVKVGKKIVPNKQAGGTFAQKVLFASVCDIAADLGEGKRNKETGIAGKVSFGKIVPGMIFMVDKNVVPPVEEGEAAKPAAPLFNVTAERLALAALDKLDEAYTLALSTADGIRAIAILKATTDNEKEAAEKAHVEASDKALAAINEGTVKIEANKVRAIEWYRANRRALPYILQTLNTLAPEGVTINGVHANPTATFIALTTGQMPTAKDVAAEIQGNVKLNQAIDQVKAKAKELRKTQAGLLVRMAKEIATEAGKVTEELATA